MKKNTLREKLEIIVSKEPSVLLNNIKLYEANEEWLDKSALIALKILRKLREIQLSQKELAEKIGVSPQYINKIVKGKENLSLETISKIENALCIKLIEIPSNENCREIIVSDLQSPVFLQIKNGHTETISEMTYKYPFGNYTQPICQSKYKS